MDAPPGFCAFCGQRAKHAHHLTGRGPDHAYLHPRLTVDLCHRHHTLVHNDLRAQFIDTPLAGTWSKAAEIEQSLARLAAFHGRFAQFADCPLWRPLAGVLADHAHDVGFLTDLNPSPFPPSTSSSSEQENPR